MNNKFTGTSQKKIKLELSIRLLQVLGVILVLLRATGIIEWSWWLVTAPFWIPAVAMVTLLCIIITTAFVTTFVKYLIDRE